MNIMLNTLARIEPERRENPRTFSNVPCTLFWGGLYEYATIRNISIYGAQLEGFSFPPVGTAVTILVDDVEICASIIWADGDKCGVLLEHEVDPASFIRAHSIRPIVEKARSPAAVTQILLW